jgi:hypothetical protein
MGAVYLVGLVYLVCLVLPDKLKQPTGSHDSGVSHEPLQ